jgi:hypothetical protein
MPDDRRSATLVAFAYVYAAETLDDVLDRLDRLIADIAASAKTLGQKKRLRSLRDLDQAALALAAVCALLRDDAHPEEEGRAAIFRPIPSEQIARAITTTHDLARPPEEDYQEEMLTRYHTVRRFLPRVLATIAFQAAPAGKPVLQAVDYVKGLPGRCKPRLDDAPLSVVDAGWTMLWIRTARLVSLPIRRCPGATQDQLHRRIFMWRQASGG